MKLKTLQIFGERTEKIYDGGIVGMNYLYPEGTERIVKSYFLFPRKLNGEKRRGLQFVEQRAEIDNNSDADGIVHYNKWRNSKFVDASQLEAILIPSQAKNIETILIPSQAKNIETAIQYMNFDEEGSLKTNGNYDEEEKRIMYEKIVKSIPNKKITALREKLDDSLPYLRESEKNNPGIIKRYFKEKFGIPISNYQDLDLFHDILIAKETEKQKRVLEIFRKK